MKQFDYILSEADIQTMGQQLRALRRARGLTQKEVSEMAGISHIYYALLETDRRTPSVRTLKKLQAVFEQPITIK